MKNPFRSEAEAYRFLIGTVVYFVAIAVATAVGGRWVGLAVFVVLSVLVLVWFFRRETQERLPASAPARSGRRAANPRRRERDRRRCRSATRSAPQRVTAERACSSSHRP